MIGRRVRLGLLGTILLALAPSVAQAQLISRPSEKFRSPKRFALEARFAPYSPDVDAEFGGAKTPHRRYFGKDRSLMFQLELDYQFFTGFGSAAIGASIGYFRQKAPAFRVDRDTGLETGERSGDEITFSLYPTALMLVYRADQLWKHFGIPFVPYGKAGLSYTIWSVYDANENVTVPTAVKKSGRGRGGTRGWQAAVGISLVLDFIDPGSARALDSETGINHTHVFIEWNKYAISGLGQSGRLNVGDTTWTAGLMFEF